MTEDSESDYRRNNIDAENALAAREAANERDEKEKTPQTAGTRCEVEPNTGKRVACGIMGGNVASCNGRRLSSADERWIRLGPVQAAQIDALVAELAHALGEPAETVRRLVEVSIVARGVAALREEGSR